VNDCVYSFEGFRELVDSNVGNFDNLYWRLVLVEVSQGLYFAMTSGPVGQSTLTLKLDDNAIVDIPSHAVSLFDELGHNLSGHKAWYSSNL
jgi:hypothetical protein